MLCILLTVFAFILFVFKRHELSLGIFFGVLTNGYQIIPSSILMQGSPLEKSTDIALFYVLAIFIIRFKNIRIFIQKEHIFRWIIVFLIFVSLDAIYSSIVLEYDLSGIIRVFRNQLFWLSFSVVVTVPVSKLARVLHFIAVVTLIQCCLYLIQIPTGLTLLQAGMSGSEVSIHDASETGMIRFYNLPLYLTPVLFYYLFQYRYQSWVKQGLVVGILLLTILAPLHRSYIFTILIVVSLYILIRQSTSQRALYITLLVVLGYGISLIDIVSNRLEKGITDLTGTLVSGKSVRKVDVSDNTFTYRMAHLAERFDYIIRTPAGYVFGIGLLTETARQARRLPFEYGTHSKLTDDTAQIDTGDIAWSLLILHLGIIGTGLFLFLIIQFIKLFYRYKNSPFSTVGLLTTLTALFISFAGTEILQISFRTLISLLAVLVVKAAYKPSVNQSELHSINLAETRQQLTIILS